MESHKLGQIGDALIVLLKHFRSSTPLTAEEHAAINALKQILNQVADVKKKYKRPAMRVLPGDDDQNRQKLANRMAFGALMHSLH